MSLEAFAAARRTKLELLRKRRADERSGRTLSSSRSDPSLLIKRHFRNYDPITGQMKRFTSARHLPDTVEKDVANLQNDTIAQDERRRMQDLDLTNIAPKRPNWDLKRDLDKNLRKLQKRDQQAVLILIRQRIQRHQTAAGLDANSADRNESSVTGLGAEIAATATADLDHHRSVSSIDANSDSDTDDN